MKFIEGKTFGEERALYNLKDAVVDKCNFEGEEDGESALKEARNIKVTNSTFKLRYPLWHVNTFTIDKVTLDDTARAPLWYCKNGNIKNVTIRCVKALRETCDVNIDSADIQSTEFGWKCDNIKMTNTTITSEYLFFDSKNITLKEVTMKGKYSFQYIENLTIENCNLDTKDAFWHTDNVVVKNSTIKGEYLAWFASNITFINCIIIGTQPLCYCKNLKLINCTMIDCDLSFEYSDVDATIIGVVESIKNPSSGKIVADKINKIILEDSIMDNNCIIIDKSK